MRPRRRRRLRRAAPDRPGPPPHRPALPRPQLQPGELLLLLRPHRSAGRDCRRRGREHTLGGATRLRTRTGRSRGNSARRRTREDPPRLAPDGDGPDVLLPRQRTRRAAPGPHRVAAARGRRDDRCGEPEAGTARVPAPKTFDATLSLQRRELVPSPDAGTAGPLPGDVAAGRREDLRAGRAAEAEGRPLPPPPRGGRGGAGEGRGGPRRSSARCSGRTRGGEIEVVENGRSRVFGEPVGPPRDRPHQRPGRLARPAERLDRARRELRRRPLGDRRPGRADPDRRPQPLPPARSAERRDRPHARRLPPRPRPRPREHQGRRPGQHQRPLRPRQRPLLELPRPDDDVLLRVLPARGREPRGGAAGEARPHLRAPPARSRHPPAGDRHRLGRDGDPRGAHHRLPGDDDDDLQAPSTNWRPSGCARRGSRTGSRSCSRTTAT